MTLCLARQRASARFSALHSQNETEIIQFSTAASRAVRSARSDDACRIQTRNAAAVSLKSAYPRSAGSSSPSASSYASSSNGTDPFLR